MGLWQSAAGLFHLRGNSSSFVVLKRKSHTKKRNLNCGHILETVVTSQGRVSHLFHGNWDFQQKLPYAGILM